MAYSHFIAQPVYYRLAAIAESCPRLYRTLHAAGVEADSCLRITDPIQRQGLFEGFAESLVRSSSAFSRLRYDKQASFLGVALKEPELGVTMSALLAGYSFVPSRYSRTFMDDMIPARCAAIISRMPFYCDRDFITAADNHLTRGLHGRMSANNLFSSEVERNFDQIPLVLGKENEWYYTTLAMILLNISQKNGKDRIVSIMGHLEGFNNGPELLQILSGFTEI